MKTMTQEKVLITTVNELQTRVGRSFRVKDKEIALFRLSDGSVRAIGNVCPHKQGPLAEGTVSGEYVFCPLHDYKISLVDGKVQEPDEGCVDVYETAVENENIYIWI